MSLCLESVEVKLIVSVSFGRAPLIWKSKSCPDSDAGWCWLGHGDVLFMDGQCQDGFLHCTDSGLQHQRINVTFRWIRQRCLPTCAQGSSVAVTEFVEKGVLFEDCGCSQRSCAYGGYTLCPSCRHAQGYAGVPIAGHAQWAEVRGGIIVIALWEFTGFHSNALGKLGEVVVFLKTIGQIMCKWDVT